MEKQVVCRVKSDQTEARSSGAMARDRFRRRTTSFPGFLPNGTLAGCLTGEAAEKAAKLLRDWQKEWVQLAGHKGTFTPAGPHSIWKKQTEPNTESRVYEAMIGDPVCSCAPVFKREIFHDGNYYIEIEDLLKHFDNPSVMDIKMGTRTFLESEVLNESLRKDLYKKMMHISPSSASKQENKLQAITKLRYMKLREELSSTSTLGFRIDALRRSSEEPETNLQKVKTLADVCQCMSEFVSYREDVVEKLLSRLRQIRLCLSHSTFMKTHELIGSSLLVLYDNTGKAGCWMIDFGKTLESKMNLNHRNPWQLGNHEDGYLTGLDNLIRVFEKMNQLQKTGEHLRDLDINSNK